MSCLANFNESRVDILVKRHPKIVAEIMHIEIELALHKCKLTFSFLIFYLSLEDFIKDLLVSYENYAWHILLEDLIVDCLLTSVLFFVRE